jgi:hypothetical protein
LVHGWAGSPGNRRELSSSRAKLRSPQWQLRQIKLLCIVMVAPKATRWDATLGLPSKAARLSCDFCQ